MLTKYFIYASIFALCIAGCSKDNTNRLTPEPPAETTSVKDVQYGQNTTMTGETQNLLLDIYSPADASPTKKYPLIVMAHGGIFLYGDKSNLADMCQAFAEKGYIAVSIDYRLGWNFGNAQTPAACKGDTVSLNEAIYRSLQDFNASLRFLVSNASKYNIDTSWIFIGGGSAGAVAAMNTTYVTPEFVNSYYNDIRQRLGGLRNADNNLTNTFTIKGNISLWGAVVNPDLVNPSTAVPLIAFHGGLDQTIPLNSDHYATCPNYPYLWGSQYLYDKLRSYGVPAVLHVSENEGHDPESYNNPTFITDNADCFLKGLMNKVPESGSYQNMASSCQ